MQTATLLTYSLVAAVSVVSPGPATMLAIRNGAAGGVRAVLPSTLGNVTGCSCCPPPPCWDWAWCCNRRRCCSRW